ncbi:DrmB family protein [Hydrogenimonas sp.]
MGRKNVVGAIRPSQLLWTYGPGAMIDLPNMSVLTMGLDDWDTARCERIEEGRLLAVVRKRLGPQVKTLYTPPVPEDESVDPLSAEAKVGVPVLVFPRWLRCVRCQTLATVDSGLFKPEMNPYRPDRARFVHTNCEKGKGSPAVPARFMLACRAGHLDDFPWHWFVHDGPSECRETMKFVEQGASLQTENLWVVCGCGAKKSMAKAFGKAGAENLPACRGRHPHIHRFDESCEEEARAVLLGASNGWFPVSISVLAIPPVSGDELEKIVEDGWEYFEDVESEEELKIVVKTLVKTNKLAGVEKHDIAELWRAIVARKEGVVEEVTEEDVKRPEWEVLIKPEPKQDWPHFYAKQEKPPRGFESLFASVLKLERLREVVALVGFTRVEAPEEGMEEGPTMAPLSKTAPEWVPVTEVHGEGIFLRFDEEAIRRWEESEAVKRRNETLRRGHAGWRAARKLDPALGYPGARYVAIHTFAHLLIREMALECGYNAASIRERVYADEGMAGVLIYTAAPDSDGTLGGLVELGEPETLGRLIRQALDRAKICASDPLCAEHDPSEDRTTHAAACHACVFVSETSCERGNRYLDRAFVVPTVASDDAVLFAERPES